MTKAVGIKFRKNPKVYYFAAGDLEYTKGGGVIVETAQGIEFARVSKLPFDVDASTLSSPLKPVSRIATEEDLAKVAGFEAKHDEVMRTVSEMVFNSGLEMKPVDAEFSFNGQKMVVSFTAEQRVDFRDLVRQLASKFKARIELRQIGVRDECRMIGTLGLCGRVCCCASNVSNDFPHVSIKMAKTQSLSLNPTKISGQCGRLMCCLQYENAHYHETNKRMPKMGSVVKTQDGKEGTVVNIMQLKEKVKLKIVERDNYSFSDYPLSELVFKARPQDKPQEKSQDKPQDKPQEKLQNKTHENQNAKNKGDKQKRKHKHKGGNRPQNSKANHGDNGNNSSSKN